MTAPDASPSSRISPSPGTRRYSRSATWSASVILAASPSCCPAPHRLRCSRAGTRPASSALGLQGRDHGPFRYRDKGNLATIGRAAAVADIKGVHLSGFLAWGIWLFVHLWYLIGFQNRLLVLIRWSFSFATSGRGARLITNASTTDTWRDERELDGDLQHADSRKADPDA